MGYTHYWKRSKKFNSENFEKVVRDFKKVMPLFSRIGIVLSKWDGKGNPEITNKEISFNGLEKCSHTQRNLGITWPSDNANGIALATEIKATEVCYDKLITKLCGEPEELAVNDSDVSGQWFAGLKLKQRTCGGDCSHESFILPLEIKPEKWQKPIEKISYYKANGEPVYNSPEEIGRWFTFCKTAYKPYDLAVNICLVIAKHYLKDDILISSDGEMQHWVEAIIITQKLLGYGKDFKLSGDDD